MRMEENLDSLDQYKTSKEERQVQEEKVEKKRIQIERREKYKQNNELN